MALLLMVVMVIPEQPTPPPRLAQGGRKVLAWSQEHLPRETLSRRGGVKTDYNSVALLFMPLTGAYLILGTREAGGQSRIEVLA